jgi:hypothetical protein
MKHWCLAFFFFFRDRVSPSPHVGESDLKNHNPPISASQVLGLQVSTTEPRLKSLSGSSFSGRLDSFLGTL